MSARDRARKRDAARHRDALELLVQGRRTGAPRSLVLTARDGSNPRTVEAVGEGAYLSTGTELIFNFGGGVP